MTEANVGSASHLGEKQSTHDSHFVNDYTYRRVPMPVLSYLAIADNAIDVPPSENLSRQALDLLREYIEPAVIAEEELDREHMEALIRDAFTEVDRRLADAASAKNLTGKASVSLTLAVADRRRAYIGHLGTNRVYLLHSERLYDLTPTEEWHEGTATAQGAAAPEPVDESPTLFEVSAGPVPLEDPKGTAPAAGEEPTSVAVPQAPMTIPPVPGTTDTVAVPPLPPDSPAVPEAPGAFAVTPERGATPPPGAVGSAGVPEAAPEGPGGMTIPGEAEAFAPAAAVVAAGRFLGSGKRPPPAYNEVQLSPGDTLILCTDGLWKTVSEEEIVETLLESQNLQRSASQLVRLAFNREASDNASIAAWQYAVPGAAGAGRDRDALSRERNARTFDRFLLAVLAIVLAGIFAVGFAFGWRITDAIRKPQKDAAREAREAETRKTDEARKLKEEEEKRQQEAQEQAAAQAVERSATIDGDGVRMRNSANTSGSIIGFLKDGQQVTILTQTEGSDGKQWCRIRATVRSGGADSVMEGFVRSDFLKETATQAPPSTTPASSPET